MYRVRDFVETGDGLIFAVVSYTHPPGGILSHLRFRRTIDGIVKLASSREARQLLLKLKPEYLRFVEEYDRELTIVPTEDLVAHHRPAPFLKAMMEGRQENDIFRIVNSIMSRAKMKLTEIGISGSHLVGAQTPTSDIDLVIYGLGNYHQATSALGLCVDEGILSLPREEDWEAIYRKRRLRASDYTLAEFVWHESRKHNRAVLGDRRVDVLSARNEREIQGRFGEERYTRLAQVTATGRAVDCSLGWDYPAKYAVTDCRANGCNVEEVVSFTHTYVDQIREGERGLFRGVLERVDGKRQYHRILVGTSREAPGECIKVLEA